MTLPGSLTGKGSLTVEGRVVGGRQVRRSRNDTHELAVFFDAPNAAAKHVLRDVMARHALGGAALDDATGDTAARARFDPKGNGSRPAGHSAKRDPRRLFARRVLALLDGDNLTLIGRDLSCMGMRVKPEAGLALGNELKVALYGRAGIPPVAVRAVVYRDDGDAGLYLRFRAVSKASQTRLEKLMASLPLVTSTPPESSDSPGVVVSEVLERR